MIQSQMTERPSNPLMCVTVFDARVSEARAMLRAGKSDREVQEKHGGVVLREALSTIPRAELDEIRRPQ